MKRLAALLVVLPFLACNRSTEPDPVPSASAPPGGGNTWSGLAPLLEARQEVGVGELGGRIYVAGGYRADFSSASTLEVYDPATDRWTMAAPMPQGLNHPGAAVVGGRFYVLGGDNGRGSVATNYQYDPGSNTWAVRAPMPTARSAPMAAVIGGRIYVAGGSPESVGRTLEAYDPATDTWTSLPPMPTGRNHLAGGAIGGRLYVVGGRPPLTLSVLEVFDTATNTWSSRAAMPTGRSGHGAAVLRGCLYVFGGEGNAGAADGVFPQSELYDPGTNSWTSLAAMRTPRHGIGAAVLGNRIFIPGGATVQGLATVATHDVYEAPAGRTCS